MKTLFKFNGDENHYDADLNIHVPTAKDKVIHATKKNMVVNAEEFFMTIEGVRFDIFPKKCEYSGIVFSQGHLVNFTEICEEKVDEYLQTLGVPSWDVFIHTDENGRFIPEEERDEDEDYTTDESYWSEWEIEENEIFYLQNGVMIEDFNE